MSIGDRIRNRRIELQLTQQDLADRMGYLSKAAICKAEKNADNMTSTRLSQFAKALNTTESYLMGWESDPVDVEFLNALEIMRAQEKVKNITVDEYSIIDAYRNADDLTKQMVKKILGV